MSAQLATGRPHAVPGTAVKSLLDAPEELAKRWLMALLGARPLGSAGTIPLELFAREAPLLCVGVARALGSDSALALLAERSSRPAPYAHEEGSAGAPALRLARVAGLRDGDGAAAVEAVEALRGALSAALSDGEPGLPPAELARVGDRLAHVCSVLATSVVASLTAGRPHPPPAPPGPPAPPAPPSAATSPTAGRGREPGHDREQGGAPRPERERERQHEHEHEHEPGREPEPSPGYPRIEHRGAPPRGENGREEIWQILDEAPAQAARHPHRGASTVPESAGVAEEWSAPIGPALDRHADDGLPFAILLIEVAGVERLRQAEPMIELDALMRQVQRALVSELRPSDRLAQEGAGRWWLVATETHVATARALAERLAQAVRTSVSHRGVPLEIAVGVASCPEDGGDADQLANHAEQELYSARAFGLPVAPVR